MTSDLGEAPVVTIFESYGSGAEVVGPAVARALGVRFIGQAFSSEEIEDAERDRSRDSLLTRALATLGRTAAATDVGVFSGPAMAHDVSEGVRRVRESVSDGGVVLGRNATVILADVPRALHVKLDGPVEQRVARAAAEAGIDVHHARSRQAREDHVRAEMSVRLHNWDPRQNDRFDLVVNTGMLGLDAAVELILAAQRIKAPRR